MHDGDFEIMCDASDYAIGAALEKKEDKKSLMIYYANKTLDSTQYNYTTMEKESWLLSFPYKSSGLTLWGLL